jgi:hypothetical protein
MAAALHWSQEAEALLNVLLELKRSSVKALLEEEHKRRSTQRKVSNNGKRARRFPCGFWKEMAREMHLFGVANATSRSCRSKYVEKLAPGVRDAAYTRFEPWEDEVIMRERLRGTSFADIARYRLKHRSDRALINRTRAKGYVRRWKAHMVASKN